MIIFPFTWSLDGILSHLVTCDSVCKLTASRVFYFLADYEENTNRITVMKLGLKKEMREKNKERKCFYMEERGNLIPPQLRCVL
jgi:hypothetical protein